MTIKINKKTMEYKAILAARKAIAKEGTPQCKSLFVIPSDGKVVALDGKRLIIISGLKELAKNNKKAFLADIVKVNDGLYLVDNKNNIDRYPKFEDVLINKKAKQISHFSTDSLRLSTKYQYSCFLCDMIGRINQNCKSTMSFNVDHLKDIFDVLKVTHADDVDVYFSSPKTPIQTEGESLSGVRVIALQMPLLVVR